MLFSARMVESGGKTDNHSLFGRKKSRYVEMMEKERSGFEEAKHVIILITGASHTGKTLLAQQILEKYNYPYLSVDHLKMGLIRSGKTDLTPEDDEALTEYLWPIIREMIKTAVENRQNLVVEGCYIPFDWRKDFDERYSPSIRFICLAMTEQYIDHHFDEIIRYESEIESRLVSADCTISGLKADNKRYIDGCQRIGEQVILIDSNYPDLPAILQGVAGFPCIGCSHGVPGQKGRDADGA